MFLMSGRGTIMEVLAHDVEITFAFGRLLG